MVGRRSGIRCPTCGLGVLTDVSFDLDLLGVGTDGRQEPDSRQLETFSCGHQLVGAALECADAHALAVERRSSEETATPVVERGDGRGGDGSGSRPDPGAAKGDVIMSILVRHVMTEVPSTLGADMSAADAATLMLHHDIGAVPITDGDRLVGLVTDRDIVTRVVAERKDPTQITLGDFATKKLVTVTPDTDLPTARDLMSAYQIRRIPVEKDGALVGILSLGDLAVAESSKRAVGETLVDISESDSTAEMNDGPDRGTPERVRRRSER